MPSMEPNEAFVQTLRAEMFARHMTMQQLADAADVSINSLKNYMSRGRPLSIPVANALGQALGLTPRALMQMAIDRMDRAEAEDTPSSK